MPVSVLLCEGKDDGADGRLLRAIVSGPEIRPTGGKSAVQSMVLHLRKYLRNDHICAVIDGDFPRQPATWLPSDQACAWSHRREGKIEQLGWCWRRKEIENYWVDAEVLSRTFTWSHQQKVDYQAKLARIFDDIGPATAARMALTACAPRQDHLKTAVPLDADRNELERLLRERAVSFSGERELDEDKLIEEFRERLSDCQAGGRFREHAAAVFAGKDILARIQNSAGFPPHLKEKPRLVEQILQKLEADPAPHTWLPEWVSLREVVGSWEPTARVAG